MLRKRNDVRMPLSSFVFFFFVVGLVGPSHSSVVVFSGWGGGGGDGRDGKISV